MNAASYKGKPCKYGHDGTRYQSTRQCVTCMRGNTHRWRERHPERARELKRATYLRHREKNLEYARNNPWGRREYNWKKLGIAMTRERYGELFLKQGGKCAICGIPPVGAALSVDHNHATGKVRGLLCRRCNNLVGQIENGVADKASVYIKAHS